jgi:glutamine---fructose-6-phosphate transaminase (isomerizing)
MTYIETEIRQQATVIQALLDAETANVQQIAAAINTFDPAFICIAARGTSDNAARYAQYLFATHARKMVALATPSVHTLYQSPPDLSRAVVIGISQSGQSDDVRRVIRDGKAQGALTVAITNDASSPLATESDHAIALHAGPERSVAATKTYTTELVAAAMLIAAVAGATTATEALQSVPGWVQHTLDTSLAVIPAWVERYRYMDRYVVIGRGYNYATAFEISLKIKELCYIAGEEYSEADFRHGPIALVQPGFPVMLIAPTGATFDRQRDLLNVMVEREAECLVISNDAGVRELAHRAMPIPDVPEWLSPVVAVIPGQVFAVFLAQARGLPLDAPRHLQKVTNTT